jgi:D-3-phosphoglycerate dehydrogenase
MDELRPYLNLAERMGSLMGQLIHQTHDLTITYGGEVANLDTRPLTHAVLKGLLSAHSDEPVNYVSAPALAKQKGLRVRETVSPDTLDYTSLIRLQLEGHADELNDVWGTIFGKEYPRIVRLGRIYMDAIPEGPVLVIQNHDKPGVIGNLGTTLARHNINIGRFQLGRREGRALCLVNVDTPVDEKAIAEIRGLPNIISVQQVKLD